MGEGSSLALAPIPFAVTIANGEPYHEQHRRSGENCSRAVQEFRGPSRSIFIYLRQSTQVDNNRKHPTWSK
jgi:hypothetical protein